MKITESYLRKLIKEELLREEETQPSSGVKVKVLYHHRMIGSKFQANMTDNQFDPNEDEILRLKRFQDAFDEKYGLGVYVVDEVIPR